MISRKLNIRIVKHTDLSEALKDIESSKVISFDCETSGLDPRAPGAYLASLGISTLKNDWVFLFNHYKSPLYEKRGLQKALFKKIDRVASKKFKVAHNGKFDFLWLALLFNARWYPDFDTMLAHYNINENAPHSLKDIVANQLGWDDGYDISLDEKRGIKGSIYNHAKYLGKDAYFTLKLYYYFDKIINKGNDIGTKNIFNHITMKASKLYCDAQLKGVYINKEQLETTRQYWKEIADKAKSKLDDMHPSDTVWKDKNKVKQTGINWSSPAQLSKILFDKLKLKSLKKTPGGSDSTDESVLMRLSHTDETSKLILDYREATKNMGTFLDSWENHCYNSRIYPNFKIHGTVTGRPSCTEPNLQQVPRNPIMRSIIQAPPGYVLIDVDYSQAELRIAAEMSKDPVLIECYRKGIDLHGRTVYETFGIPIEKQTKEQRKKGKAVNFGFLYGMYWKKFVEYARDNYGQHFTNQEAEKIRQKFFTAYPALESWHRRQKSMANSMGYVVSILGRKRRLPDALKPDTGRYDPYKAEAERQSINSPVQSFASDLTLMSAIQISEEIKEVEIVGSVHDSILMECKEEDLSKVASRILKIMRAPKLLKELGIKMTVPLEGELEVGPWGKGVKWVE